MKKYKYLLLVFAIGVMSACQKLDRDFVTTIGRNEIEQSITNVQALLTAIYSNIPDGTVYIGGAAMMASATDEAEFTNESNPVQNFNTGGWNAINNPDLVWGTYYRAVRQVDQFLLSTGKINLDQYKNDPSAGAQITYNTNLATIKRWTYEARFLRAYFYFELVKRYGGVPILNDALAIDGDFSKVSRSSLDSCIKFISSECDSAAANLPLTSSTAPYVVASDLNRVSKLAALSLKSRVLLYAASDLFNTPSWATGYSNQELISLPTGDRIARWKAASDAAKAVIDATGIPTLGGYKALFNTFNNAEIIFCRSNSAAGNNNQFEKNNEPIGYPGATINANTPSQDMVDAYDVKVNSTTTAKFDWSNAAMAAAPYASRDPRLDYSIIRNDSAFGTPSRKPQMFIGGLDAKPIPNATKTGYYLRKYQQESLNINSGNVGSHSWIIFRYPEIYLNYAEALNEWSPGNADIKKYYDIVRTRTGVAMPPLLTTLSQAEIREKIRNEDRVEFAFEDHRFWDVRRWMQAPIYFNAPLRGIDITRTSITPAAYTYVPNVVENRVFQPKMYLYPIPQSDLSISPALIQNPLW